MHQMQAQQQMIQQQRAQAARQAMLAQQYSGVPVMQNSMNITPAQFNAMRSGGAGPIARPVNLPQHLQQQQAQAEHSFQQQQTQAQAQHQVGFQYLSLSLCVGTIQLTRLASTAADDDATNANATAAAS
jgi:hypothetical protein